MIRREITPFPGQIPEGVESRSFIPGPLPLATSAWSAVQHTWRDAVVKIAEGGFPEEAVSLARQDEGLLGENLMRQLASTRALAGDLEDALRDGNIDALSDVLG